MRRILTLAAAFLLAASACVAQTPNSTGYAETTVVVAATTWTVVSTYAGLTATPRRGLYIGDVVGLGCRWSLAPSPAANEGFPFSTTAAGGSQQWDIPVPNNTVRVYCTNAGTITVAGG